MHFLRNRSRLPEKAAPPSRLGQRSPSLYAAAVRQARHGRYTEALRLISRGLDAGHCSTVEALDLQARIYAQQGFYLHAEHCWRKVKVLDETWPGCDAAMARLRHGYPVVHGALLLPLGMAAIVVLCVFIYNAALSWPTDLPANGSHSASRESLDAQALELRPSADEWQTLRRDFDLLTKSFHELEARISREPQPPPRQE